MHSLRRPRPLFQSENCYLLPLSWFQHNQHLPTTILIEATATKQATDSPKHFSRAKHMETFLAWVRHVIQEGFIRTQTIPRDDNVADFMVKAQVKSAHRTSAESASVSASGTCERVRTQRVLTHVVSTGGNPFGRYGWRFVVL